MKAPVLNQMYAVAVLFAWAFASCGEPAVSYEVQLPADLAGHGDLFKACLQRCDASRRGAGCKDAAASLELGTNPCNFACALKVSEAVDEGCPKAAAKLWQCEAAQAWKCASAAADAIPQPVHPSACSKPDTDLKACVADGGESVGGQPALTVQSACKARCAASEKACDAPDPNCANDCTTAETADLAQACTLAAAKLIKCQAKDVGCVGGKPFYVSCSAEATALAQCEQAHKPPTAAQTKCLDACAGASSVPACAEWADGACKEMCKPYEGFSAVCDPPLAKLWACIQQHGASQCVAQTGAAPCATEQALAAACVQNCTLTDKCQCAPGGTVCVGKSVVSCAANGVLSKTLLNCAQYGSSCADGACVGLKTCPKPYASSCAGNKAIYCDASGVVTLKEDCETAPNQKCVAGQCLEICQPNTVFCSKKNYNAGALWNCSSSGVVDGVAKVCAGPTAGCLFEGCEAGETACSTKPSPDGTPCDDNDSCTIKDVCTAAKCIGKPAEDCVDTIPCTENGCDSAAGGCTKWLHHGLCDDGNACTADICTKSTGCWNGMTPDNCVLGTLVGPSCWTAQAYQFALKAAEIHEQCNWTANVAMPASIHSAADTAAAIARLASSQITKPTLIGLVNKPPSGAWLWSDGSKVDYTNWSGGQEPPGPGFVVINPKTGVWSKVAGSDAVQAVLCKTPDIADTCSDNDACTGGETCAQGKCQGAKQLCDDTNPCTLDQCDAATATVACTNKPVAAGATCDDGKTCSVGDACDGKGSCVASAAKPCDDGNPCTIDSCAEPAGCVYNYPAFPTKCGDGLACLEGACKPAGTCGDGVVNAGGEQCDDKNQQAGDGCSAQCTLEAATSCASLLDKFPALKDGDYLIDVDAGGPQPPVTLYCAMSKGGWTLVANLYDSAGDDFPNLAGDVTEGWQQTGSGQWGPVVQIAKVATDTGSAALGLQAVLALSVSGMKKLKICLVTQSGQEGECRSSPDSLTLGGTAEPSSPLAVWQGKPLVWTYGRLIGLPASGPSFAPADLVAGAGCVDAAAGKVNEFGQACTNLLKSGLCEAGGTTGMSGAWCGHCDGICLRPGATVDDEMATGGGAGKELVANPSSGSWGVRIYVRP